jgi:hypothetical protein
LHKIDIAASAGDSAVISCRTCPIQAASFALLAHAIDSALVIDYVFISYLVLYHWSWLHNLVIIIYSSLMSLCNHLVMKDQPLILTDNIHSDTQAEPRKLSSPTLYIDLWQEGKPAPGQNPPVISPPVVIFRRICVRAEIRTQNPVLSNTRLIKMVPLSHLRRLVSRILSAKRRKR